MNGTTLANRVRDRIDKFTDAGAHDLGLPKTFVQAQLDFGASAVETLGCIDPTQHQPEVAFLFPLANHQTKAAGDGFRFQFPALAAAGHAGSSRVAVELLVRAIRHHAKRTADIKEPHVTAEYTFVQRQSDAPPRG